MQISIFLFEKVYQTMNSGNNLDPCSLSRLRYVFLAQVTQLLEVPPPPPPEK